VLNALSELKQQGSGNQKRKRYLLEKSRQKPGKLNRVRKKKKQLNLAFGKDNKDSELGGKKVGGSSTT